MEQYGGRPLTLPVAGWYPDPFQGGQWRFWDGTRWTPHAARPAVAPGYVPASRPRAAGPGAPVAAPRGEAWRRLDERVAAMHVESAAPWGVRPILVPMLAFVAVVVAGSLLAARGDPGGQSRAAVGILFGVAGYAVIGVAIWYAGAPIARRHGGWGAAFGWSRPTAGDARAVLPWFLANMTARLIAGALVVRAVPAWRHANASNVNLHGHPTGVILGTLLVVGVIAPPIEELWFRGLILRTLMRRFSFWPSAIASSLMFGLLHTYQLDTLAGAAQLGVSLAVFGLGQCLLVRRQARLNTAIGAHSVTNFLGALLSLAVVAQS